MKTVSEFKDEQKKLAEEKRIKEKEKIREFLINFPPNESCTTPKQLLIIREGVANKHLKFSGICCDVCKCELVHGPYLNLSNPPSRTHHCPSCCAKFTVPC